MLNADVFAVVAAGGRFKVLPIWTFCPDVRCESDFTEKRLAREIAAEISGTGLEGSVLFPSDNLVFDREGKTLAIGLDPFSANLVMGKKSLRDIIGDLFTVCGNATTAAFLDDIKNMGYRMAFRGGLSFNLGDVIIPTEKEEMIAKANDEVEEVMAQYAMGLITNNERYNHVIDIWTNTNNQLTETLMKRLKSDNQGFNPIYMMYDSVAAWICASFR